MIASACSSRVFRPLSRLARAIPAALLLASLVCSAAFAQPFPVTGLIEIGNGDGLTSELAAAPADGGFVVFFDGLDSPGSFGERLRIRRLEADGNVVAKSGPSAATIYGLSATAHPEGALVGYLRAVPFLRPTLELSLLDGSDLVEVAGARRREIDFRALELTTLDSQDVLALGPNTGFAIRFELEGMTEGVGPFRLPISLTNPARFVVAPGGAGFFVFYAEDSLPLGGDGVGEQLQVVQARDDVVFDASVLVREEVAGTPLAARVGEIFFVAWRRSSPANAASAAIQHSAALVGLDGRLRGQPFSISLEGRGSAVLEQIAGGANGVLWTLWRDGSDVLLALFDADRAADSSAAPALVAGGDAREELLSVNGGQVLVAWLEGSEPRVRGQLFEDCASGPGAGELPVLCLNGGRYTAQLEWEFEDGRSGVGFPSPARTPDSGIFYFFNPENWEMMVKVLDGCDINGHHWVFAAPSTGLGFSLVVTETASGSSRTYENPVGVLPTVIADTGAFLCE